MLPPIIFKELIGELDNFPSGQPAQREVIGSATGIGMVPTLRHVLAHLFIRRLIDA
jgi:hypothetical protein